MSILWGVFEVFFSKTICEFLWGNFIAYEFTKIFGIYYDNFKVISISYNYISIMVQIDDVIFDLNPTLMRIRELRMKIRVVKWFLSFWGSKGSFLGSTWLLLVMIFIFIRRKNLYGHSCQNADRFFPNKIYLE